LTPIKQVSKKTLENLFYLLTTGDKDSFGEELAPIRGRIVLLAQQRLQRDDVEDVVQQTLCTLWEKRSQVRDSEHLLPFLFQILRNKIGDAYRRKKLHKENLTLEENKLSSRQNPSSAIPESIFEQKDLERVLKEAITVCAAKNETWGRILQLLQEGRSRKEIHQELGDIPMATVYTRIYRARQHLLEILKEEYGVEV